MEEAITKYRPLRAEAESVFAPEAARLISTDFHRLAEQKYDTGDAWAEFTRFYSANAGLFTNEMKKIILQTAYFVALSVAGVNKSELYRLTMLQLLFNK